MDMLGRRRPRSWCRSIFYAVNKDGCELVEITMGAVVKGARGLDRDGWFSAVLRSLATTMAWSFEDVTGMM